MSRARSLVAQHVLHVHLHLFIAFVYSPRSIRPAFSLPWLERACKPWIHVCGDRLDLPGRIRLTRVSNRDGRKLKTHALVDAMQRVYNFTKPLAYLLALSGVFLCGNGRTVDLDRLAKHNVIEHDASLSRQDVQPPDDYSPIHADPNLVAQLMRVSPETFLALKDLAVARVIRESQAVGGQLGSIHAEIARAESGLILQVFGGDTLEVDKDVLCVWLVDGRLPGCWKSPKRRIGIRTTSSIRRRLSDIMDSTRDPMHTRPSLGSHSLAPRSFGRVAIFDFRIHTMTWYTPYRWPIILRTYFVTWSHRVCPPSFQLVPHPFRRLKNLIPRGFPNSPFTSSCIPVLTKDVAVTAYNRAAFSLRTSSSGVKSSGEASAELDNRPCIGVGSLGVVGVEREGCRVFGRYGQRLEQIEKLDAFCLYTVLAAIVSNELFVVQPVGSQFRREIHQ